MSCNVNDDPAEGFELTAKGNTEARCFAASCFVQKRAAEFFSSLLNGAWEMQRQVRHSENQAQKSQNHRTTKCSGLEGTSVGHPVQPPCPSRVTQSRLHSTASRRVWNISREGDSTTSLGSLGQGSVTLRGKKFFLMFRCPINEPSKNSFYCFCTSTDIKISLQAHLLP